MKITENSNSELVNFLATNSKSDDKTDEEDIFEYKEGGWGWVVVLCSGFSVGILYGMVNNYALIYNELDRVYNNTESHVVYSAWIGSTATGVQYIFCSLGSISTDFFGPKKVGLMGGLISTLGLAASSYVQNIKLYFLTYALLFGIGQALLLSATLAILPHYFKKQLSLANGLMNLISAVIVTILPMLTSKIIELYSLVETFYFLAALSFLTILTAFSYESKLPVEENVSVLEKIKSSFGLEIFQKKKFAIWCVASFFGMFGYLIPILNIDHHAIKVFPENNPVYINVIFGAGSGIGSLVFGKLGDLTKFNRVHYHTLAFLVYGLVQLTIPFASSFNQLLGQMLVLGVLDGILLCFIVTISFDLSESSKLANHAAGYYHVIISLPSIAGPVVAGKIYEVFKSYDWAFYIGAAFSILGAFILIIFILLVDLVKKFRTTQVKEKKSAIINNRI